MMFGTNVLDRSFSLAESESAGNEELSEEGKRMLEQIDENSSEEVSDEDSSAEESEEPVLEIITEEEKEVLEEEIKN